MELRGLLAAVRLSGARVRRRLDDQRRGPVPGETVGEHRRALERLGFEALDRIAPQCGDRPELHVRGFAADARERSRGVQNAELRPLGAGELLDRAVTIFVRQFVPIVVVIALTLVPTTILTALASPHAGQGFAELFTVLNSMGNPATSQRAAEQLSASNGASAWVFVIALVRSSSGW